MNPTPPTTADSAGFDRDRWFAAEVQPHEAALRNWLRVRFPALTDRDDLVQEALVRVWRARAQGPIASTKAFLFATARNLAVDALNHRAPQVDLENAGASALPDGDSDPAESAARAQEIRLLNEVLASLPERCRQVFVLRRIHGVPQKEIAARLHISEKTVEAQSAIAMHKCVRFFAQLARPAAGTAPASGVGPLTSTPQHA